MTMEVVRHVTVRTPHGGNDEREVKFAPGDDHDHDHDEDDADEKDKQLTIMVMPLSIVPKLCIFRRKTNSVQCVFLCTTCFGGALIGYA